MVGVLGVEEGEDGMAEVGPIAVARKGEGVGESCFDFFQNLLIY